MNKQELKKRIIEAIDANRDSIIRAGREIYSTPELGYKEVESTKTAVNFLKDLGLEIEENIAVTGCRARLNEEAKGPKVAILGELDSVAVADHPDAAENGNMHACGHNIQMGGLLGAALGLVKSGVLKELDGRVDIMATPAEEFIELEYRENLRKEGKITYFGGKQELIKKGAFDDVDMSMMFHALDLGENKALIGPESNGFIGKKIKFIGKESHAGSAPEEGINALNAAMLAMNNIHAQRETFKDSDRVRVHPIITKGGDIVNVVPADVRMESYVRARTVEGMLDSNTKVNRALKAGAMAVGAEIEITEIPGYLPILRYENMDEIFKGNLEELGLAGRIVEGGDFTGSFDFGDVSHLMPTLHPMIGGIKGSLHTREFQITDEELAYIVPAKAMAMTVVDLLFDGAKRAKDILANFKPVMTKDEYLEFMESNDKIIKA
ncbi:amidohydrolase [Propionigenium maris DSM 9537]|uniref:Peptidase M20 domain-containing protein 2 n=1 Tax=Propionigenium maris DSM 9537 TaxID=1123000 RepID=A0A9W6GKP0_9FUSO|nr:amidohydrolase [Propionigenium maris]GLI55506.1 amidohydrolase [Propionigenium maris DSM 9537]